MKMRTGRAIGLVIALMGSVLAVGSTAGAQNVETCGGAAVTILGTADDDVLLGTDGRDVISGLGGNDFIRGFDGRDIICGGPGRDRIFGGRQADTIFGGDEGDRINGDAGADIIYGDRGNDRIIGGGGDDILDGGRGRRDRLYGRADNDVCVDAQAGTIRATCESTERADGVLGSTVALTADGAAADWIVHDLVDEATETLSIFAPDAGNRLVSVQVSSRLTSGVLSDCSSSVLRLVGSDGASYVSNFQQVTAGTLLGCWTHSAGDVRMGWVTFEMPADVDPVRLEARMDAGFSPDVGTWDLTRGTSVAPAAVATRGDNALSDEVILVNANGSRLRTSIEFVADPANAIVPPAAGDRVVAALVELENLTGDQQGVPVFTLIGEHGEAIGESFRQVTLGDPLNFANVPIDGVSGGWIAFDIPDDLTVVKIEARRDFGTPTAEWQVSP